MSPINILRRAYIKEYHKEYGYIIAEIDNISNTLPNNSQNKKRVQVPFSFYSVNGMFIGGTPTIGTPIVIGQGEGTNWYFVSFMVSNVPQIPVLSDNELLIQANNNTYISLDADNDYIDLGSNNGALHLNTTNKIVNNKSQSTFSNQFVFSEINREITGIVKREIRVDASKPSSLKLTDEDYDNNLTTISLIPNLTTVINTKNSSKNPPFVEKREMIYEFAKSSNVIDDIKESALYSSDQQLPPAISPYVLPNRRESKTDTLSLSLVAPNFLLETTKGTVIDIFGNILDINRMPILGYGTNDPNLTLNSTTPKDQSFFTIKAAERKSLAYHFEINARKDLTANGGQAQLPNINSNNDWARTRSRFFFDIDKEGQLKLNVPSSSEVGNIPLHVHYENYSTYGPEDNGNVNKFIFLDNYQDIFLDSFDFANTGVNITDSSGTVLTPIDRITGNHIQHGMPFHNIINSGFVFQSTAPQWLGYQTVYQTVDVTKLPTLSDAVSATIIAAGINANAGGRSGNMHFDGSLDVSLGANTVDRQSLWLDMAGGIVANIGRDKNFVSGLLSLDGDLLVQIGGLGVAGDSRFTSLNNAYRQGALDIRVMNEGNTVSMIRIDGNGVTVMTPSTVTIHGRNINLQADADISIDADNLYLQQRLVSKFPAVSI